MSLESDARRLLAHADQQVQAAQTLLQRDPDWLSVRDVAARLSVSPWQVRKWIECGQFDEIVVFSKKLTRISFASYQRFVAKKSSAA